MSANLSTDDILVAIRADNKDLKSKLRDVERNIKKFGQVAEKQNKKTAKSFKAIGYAIKGFIGMKVVGFFLDLAKGAAKSSAEMEKHKIAFTTMLGSAEKAKTLLQDIKKFSATTPFQLNGLIETSKQLIAFGVSEDEVIEKMRNLGNAAQGNQEILTRLARAYGKVKAKGKATLEELNMFTEAGVPIMQELADQHGVTTQAMFKMIETGKIGFKEVDEAMTGLTTGSGKFAGMLGKQSRSLGGLFSTLKDRMSLLVLEMGDQMNPALKALTEEMMDASTEGGVLSLTFKSLGSIISFLAKSLTTLFLLFGKVNNAAKMESASEGLERAKQAVIALEKEYEKRYGSTWRYIVKNNKAHKAEYQALKKNRDAVRYYSDEIVKFSEKEIDMAEKMEKLWADQTEAIKKAREERKKLELEEETRRNASGSGKGAGSQASDADYYAFIGDERRADQARELAELDTQYAALQAKFKDNKEKLLEIEKAYFDQQQKIINDYKEFTLENFQTVLSVGGQIASQMGQTLRMELNNNLTAIQQTKDLYMAILDEKQQQQIEKEDAENEAKLAEIEAQAQRETDILQNKLDQGLITQEQYNIELDKIEKAKAKAEQDIADEALDAEKKRAAEKEKMEIAFDRRTRRIKRAAAREEKKIRIAETIINTVAASVGVFKALATAGPLGPILAAAAAATTMAFGLKQVALISKQPLPQAREGAYAKKPTAVEFGHGEEAILPLNDFVYEKIADGINEQMAARVARIEAMSLAERMQYRANIENNLRQRAEASGLAMASKDGGYVFSSKRNINLMLDGEKIASVVDEHRERTAKNLGAHDYYQESAY